MDSNVPSVASSLSPAPGLLLKWLIVASLPLYVLDQVTKYLVWRNIDPRGSIPVVPGWFDLVHVGNTGAAWGFMRNSNGFFAALSLAALVTLGAFYYQGAFEHAWFRAGLFLLVPGILGNLTDRIVHGHVVDFLSFDLHVPFADPWPAFNVADSCICLAVGCFLIGSFLDLQRGRL